MTLVTRTCNRSLIMSSGFVMSEAAAPAVAALTSVYCGDSSLVRRYACSSALFYSISPTPFVHR
jgi:hypothetical protein